MDAGVAGNAITLTAIVCAAVLLQVLLAVTLTLPPVALKVAVILLVVEVPDQPLGNVHV